jgi:hypothetical protein
MSVAIIVPYFNFCKYQVRQENYRMFMRQLQRLRARVITVECAFGGAEFEVTGATNPDHIQVRADQPLWVKENLINLGCQYAARTNPYTDVYGWFDADIIFNNPNWLSEATQRLNQFHFVQPFERVSYLRKDGGEIFGLPSFCAFPHDSYSMPGCAWMVHRDVYEALGGLIEYHILGGGDTFLSNALLGKFADLGIMYSPDRLRNWVEGVKKLSVNSFVTRRWGGYQFGAGPGTLDHLYHGPMEKRAYGSRYGLLWLAKYDPEHDLTRNSDGVIQLVGKPDLQAQIAAYFHGRSEDA